MKSVHILSQINFKNIKSISCFIASQTMVTFWFARPFIYGIRNKLALKELIKIN
jgi:hypothetical protein